MEQIHESTIDSSAATHTNVLAKTISIATLVLYVLGWAAALAWQGGWEVSMRASYGYQLGWGTCLVACAVALLVYRRGPASASDRSIVSHASELSGSSSSAAGADE
jgi:hypothetical protein